VQLKTIQEVITLLVFAIFFDCVSQKFPDVGARFWHLADCDGCSFRFPNAEMNKPFNSVSPADLLDGML
jgi:hypothetical protein